MSERVFKRLKGIWMVVAKSLWGSMQKGLMMFFLKRFKGIKAVTKSLRGSVLRGFDAVEWRFKCSTSLRCVRTLHPKP